jgi:NADPH2:quinone reductase
MKALAITDFGAEPTLHDLPTPEPAEGEVLVRVRASSLNGMDQAIASGGIKHFGAPYAFPIVLGRDAAGTVEAVGAGVAGFAPGDEVFGTLSKFSFGLDGTFAELVALSAGNLARRPAGLPVEAAGALGLAGTAALQSVDAIAPAAGETVLVSGASGGVGSFAVQLAKARGARVIATARGDEVAFVRGLGADETVDYTGDVAAQVRALAPEGVEAVVHAAGAGGALADLLARGGRIASTLGFGPDQLAGRDATATAVMANPTTETLERLASAVASGALRVPVETTYPLAEAGRALADFRAGKRGKIAVAVA